jgi:organic hydroperoxide reductase OsmC/OhrA
MSETVSEFTISVDQIQDYQFKVTFDKEQFPPLLLDEPPPLGQDAGPNPSRVLAAAIGNCLAASFLFCAQKSRVACGPLAAKVRCEMGRNERGRLRIQKAEITLDANVAEADRERAQRCLGLFEDFCVVTQSVREGIDIKVNVKL